MIPDRPIPPENPDQPKRGQISLDTLRKESVETNLWNLDGDLPPLRSNVIPTPRTIQPAPPQPDSQDPYASMAPPDSDSELPAGQTMPARDDIGDLEDLDIPDIDAVPSQPPSPAAASIAEPSPATSHPAPAPIPTSPQPSNRRKPMLSRPDTVGIGVIALLLVVCAGYFLFNAFRDLPRTVDPHEMPDFPIKGDFMTLTAADSYWRLPVTTGPDADVVQRGTRLIPVIEVVARSENSTMRVQFRNSEGTPVGDPVTVPVRGNPIITIPSTSGFEDVSIHNAYRIGMVEPWSVEILEAPASSTSGGAFRVLATFPISTERR